MFNHKYIFFYKLFSYYFILHYSNILMVFYNRLITFEMKLSAPEQNQYFYKMPQKNRFMEFENISKIIDEKWK